MASDSSWTNSSRGVVNGIVRRLPFTLHVPEFSSQERLRSAVPSHAACQAEGNEPVNRVSRLMRRSRPWEQLAQCYARIEQSKREGMPIRPPGDGIRNTPH